MARGLRYALAALAVVQLLSAMALFWEVPFFVGMWPFPGTSPLSTTLLASFLAAAAASTGWVAWAGRERALAGISWDYLATFGLVTVFGITRIAGGETSLIPFVIACGGATAVGAAMYLRARRVDWVDARPMPRVVRLSFAIFVLTLVPAGGALIAGVPNVLPWTITPDLSVVFGLMFLGSSAYFVYGLLHPVLDNAIGQLAGFLAYDIVLAIPFLQRLPSIDDRMRLGMVLYLVVIGYSAVIAVWALVVNPGTRLGQRR